MNGNTTEILSSHYSNSTGSTKVHVLFEYSHNPPFFASSFAVDDVVGRIVCKIESERHTK